MYMAMFRRVSWAGWLLCFAMWILPGLNAVGVQYEVNTLSDQQAEDGMVSLREAIEAANQNTAVNEAPAGSDTETDRITFDQAALQAEAGVGNPLVITLSGTRFEITDPLEIEGPGREVLTLDAAELSQHFYANQTDFSLKSLRLINGYAPSSSNRGGSIYGYKSDLTLADLLIEDGYCYQGGAFGMTYGTAEISQSIIRGNQASYIGGGCWFSAATATLSNVAVVDNNGYYGGAFYFSNAHVTLRNTTVAGNSGHYGTGGVYGGSANASLTIENSIFADNEGNGTFNMVTTVTNSVMADGVANYVRYREAGEDGTWWTDDDVHGDYRLQAGSPGMDMGANDLLQAEDLLDADGNPRVVHDRVDIGAFELQSITANLETPSTMVTTLVDTNDCTDGLISLREAVAHAGLGGLNDGIVTFDPALDGGTLILSNELALCNQLTVQAPAGGFTLDGGGNGRVLSIAGIGSEVTLDGLTLTNGVASGNGGGISVYDAELTLLNSTIAGNQCSGDGGGISVYRGALTVEDSVIRNNNSAGSHGGGIYSSESPSIVRNTLIEHNGADNSGGAIYYQPSNVADADCWVEDCVIRKNSQTNGTIYQGKGTLTIERCEIVDNDSRFSGIINRYNGNLTIRESTIAGNTTRDGVIECGSPVGTVHIENSIIAGNHDVPALYLRYDNPTLSVTSSLLDIEPNFTDPANGDYTLAPNSLAIGRGTGGHADIGVHLFDGTPSGAPTPSTHVTTLEDTIDWDDHETTLREAAFFAGMDQFNEGVVTFDSDLAGGTLALTNALTLYDSASFVAPAGGLTLDGEQRDRLFVVPASNTVLNVEGFTLTGASVAGDGGAFRILRSTLHLSNCTVLSNRLSASNCDGAGIYANGSTVTVSNCAFEGNSTSYGYGPAICALSTPVTIDDSLFIGNSSKSQGGALYADNAESPVLINNSIFESNSASSSGGAIQAYNLTATNTLFQFNTAYHGGAIYAYYGGTLMLDRVRIQKNRSTSHGGGIFINGGTQYISNSLIAENVSGGTSGGIYRRNGGSMTLLNTSIVGNLANNDGVGLWCYRYMTLNLENSVIAHNIKLPTTLNDVVWSQHTNEVASVISTLDGNPGFVAAPTAGEDGVWNTEDDISGDYRPMAGSPLHNGGDTNLVANRSIDLAGYSRIRGASVDIGAYERTELAVKAMADLTIEKDRLFEQTCVAIDADLPSDNITVNWSLGPHAPSGATIDANSGLLSWLLTTTGSWTLPVIATDGQLFATNSLTITVVEEVENFPPVIQPIAEQTVPETETITFIIEAADPNYDAVPVALTLSNSTVAGVNFTPETGEFSWTPSEAQGPGLYTFTVTATELRSDGETPLSSSINFSIRVQEQNTAPVLTLPTLPSTINEQETLSFFAQVSDADRPGNPLTFWLEEAPAGAAIDHLTGEFIWTPSEAQGPASYTFNVKAFDGTADHILPVTLEVAEVNRAPALTEVGLKTVQGQQRLYFFTYVNDPDLKEGDTTQRLTYSFSGGDVPVGATIRNGSYSRGYFEWTPTADQLPGTYTFNVTVSDGELSDTIPVTVQAILPADLTVSDLSFTEGQILEGQAVRLNAKVTNLSSGDLLQYPTLEFYVDGQATASKSVDLAELKAGQYSWIESVWTATPGPHTLEAEIDVNNQVLEIDETNNRHAIALPEITAPDLIITNLFYTPDVLVGGAEVQFSAIVTNAAGGTTRDLSVQLLVDDEIKGKTIVRGPFLSGQSEMVEFNWIAVPGNHTVALMVDPLEQVAEEERANNRIELVLSGVEDTLPPEFSQVIPGEGQRVSGHFSVSATAIDQSPLGNYTIELLGGELTDWVTLYQGATGAFTWDTTAYTEGAYQLRFSVSDQKGNLQQLNRAITIDNTAPLAAVLTAEAVEFGTKLSWDAPDDAAYSRIYRATSPSGPFAQINGTLYTGQFVDHAVIAGTSYCYLVRTTDAAGNVSPDSNIAVATPLDDQTAPTIQSVFPKDGSVHNSIIQLSANVSDNVGVTNVIFEYVTEPSGGYDPETLEWILLHSGAEPQVEWDVTNLPTGRYLVRVTVEDAAGFSAETMLTYLVDHKAPDAVGTISVDRRELALAVGWNMPLDSDISGFRLSRQTDGGEFVVLKKCYSSTLYIDHHLQPGVLYSYRVEAIDQLDQLGDASDSVPVSALDDTTDPVLVQLAPQPFSRVRGLVPLTLWATDNDALASGSFWYRAKGDMNWNDCNGEILVSWLSSENCWQLTSGWDTTGLADGEYEISARASDPFGNSLETTFSLILDTEAPLAPSNLSVQDEQTGIAATLTWAENSETDLALYQLYRREAGTTEWFPITTTQTAEYIDQNLVSEQVYEYAVSALDEAGNESALSTEMSVSITSRADLALKRVAFVPKNPTLERGGEIEAKLFNDGPARAQALLRFYITVDGTETLVGEQKQWIEGGETSYITTPWIPQLAGLTSVRVVAETMAPAVDEVLTNNELSLETIVNEAPVAVAGADRSCNWYEAVTFDASASSDPDGRIMDYLWDFGDGTTERGEIVTHKYDSIGRHTATLTVTDERSVSTTASIFVNVADTRADLIVDEITWSPGEPQEGDEITITASIKNIGNGATKKEFFAAYYIDGIYNGYVIVDQLIAPGETAEAVVKWIATKGLHTVRIVADDLINSVNETVEDNNDRQVHMTFQQIHFPDLQVSGLTCPLPETITSQNPATVTVDLLNAGTADAENVFVALYRNDEMVSRKPVADLIANGTTTTTFDIILGAGPQELTATIDGPISLLQESNESNNSRSLNLGDLTVSYPDLALALRVLPEETELAHRSWIDMQATVHNDSDVDLQETAYVEFYADGVKVGTREIRFLAAGSRETVAFQVPATEGTHDLRVVVNEWKSIVESDYSNNEQQHTTDKISIIYSDLAISNLSWYRANGAEAAYGESLQLTFDVSNLSLVSSFDKTAVILLVDGEEIERMEIGSIRGHETVQSGLKWEKVELNPNVSHEVAVMIDPDDLIPEEDEENNLVIADMPLDLEDGLILEAKADHPNDDYFGIPLYSSREVCRLTAQASRASAPQAWLDAGNGQSMTVSMSYTPNPEIQDDGSVVYPDPVAIYDDEPMLFNPLTGEFKLDVILEELQETGNYSVRVTFSDGADIRSQTIPFLVVQDCNFTMQVLEDSVVAGERIHIEGSVSDLQDMPMAGEKVLLSIYQGTDGFGSSMNPVLEEILGIAEDVSLVEVMTESDGTFSCEHRTLRGQSGNYTIKANLISSVVGAEAICNYEILNAGFDGPGVELTLPKNYSMSESVTLQNSSERALTNVQVELIEKTAALGLDVRLISDVPSVLSSGASIPLSVVFDADEEAGDYAEYELRFTCAEGIERTYGFRITLKDSLPNLQFEPNLIEVALNPGGQLFRNITVINQGLGTLKEFTVMGGSNLPWLTVAKPGATELGPNEALDLNLMIKPGEGTGLGIYRDYLTVEDADGLRFQLPVQVELTSSTRGGATFLINNDAGQWVEDAEVRLISKVARPVMAPDGAVIATRNDVFIEKTDAQGRVAFEDLPTGEYSYSIRCSGHDTINETVEIMPASLPVVIPQTLKTTPISYEWTVTPITIEDRYEITLNIEMILHDLGIPTIVSIPPWATIAQDVQAGYNDRLIFKNKGDLALYDVRVEVVSQTGLEQQITLAGNGDIGTVAADETIYLNYYVPEGDYSDLQGSQFVISGYYVMTTDTGERVEKTIETQIGIYNPASESVTIEVPEVYKGKKRLPNIPKGEGEGFPKLLGGGSGGGANAIVKLKLEQEATLEREGFEAVLTFSNGLAEDLVGFSVAPRVFDEFNNDVTASFQLVPPSLSGALSATDGSETLPGSSEFTASWILVPGKGLGGEDPTGKKYFVEATATYSQGGQLRTFETQSEEITVHPQPELELFYYLPEKILKNSPFRLGVFVENNGYGDAKKFRIASAQPEIIENESGVPVEVEIVGSSFGAGNVETETWSVEFGDVAAQGWARGYWITRCNYDATMTDFSAELEHLPYEGIELNPLITAVHTEIILGDYLFADATNPESSFSLIDRDDDGIPDYMINLWSGFRSAITVPEELRVTHEPTIDEPQMVFSIADSYGFVCMVINDPLSQINVRGIRRYHLDGSDEVYELSGNNFWRNGDTLYVVDRIGKIVDGQETVVPVEYEIDYQPMLEVREIQIGNYTFNALTAGDEIQGGLSILSGGEFHDIWFEDLRGLDGIGATEYGWKDIATKAPIPIYDTGLPIIAGDEGSVKVEFYNSGISPESGEAGIFLVDEEGNETLLTTQEISDLRSYRTLELEFPFEAPTDGFYTLEARFLDGRTEGNATEPLYINARPISDAGPDQIVQRGEEVRFDSSRSYDPDGLLVKYEWYMGNFTQDDDGNNVRADWIAGPYPKFTFEDSGTYRVLLAVTDYYGAMEEDEMVITVEENRPDLYLESVSHGESEIINGQSLTITATICNADAAMDPDATFQVSLYAEDRLLATKTVQGGLATGESRQITFDYIADANDEFLTVVIDDLGDAINEANEKNNIDAVAIFAESTEFADLMTQNVRLSVPADQVVGWGQTIQILADVHNGGLANAGKPFRVTAYLNGEYLGHARIDSLETNATTAVSFDWIPTPGVHDIEVIADWPYSYIRERDEENNHATLTVNPANLTLQLPNLKALALRMEPDDGVLTQGMNASVTTTFKNDTLVDFPYGSEAVLKVDGLVVARRSIGAIAAGKSSAVQLFWATPWKGEHEIAVEIDPSNTWFETDKTDNRIAETFTLEFKECDLSVRTLRVPYEGRAGVEMPLAIQLVNTGEGPMNRDFTVKAFVNDQLIALTRMEGLLSSGQTRWWTPNWTPDETMAGETVMVRVELDSSNEVEERDETNNERELEVLVAQGMKTTLALNKSVALLGETLEATITLTDTATETAVTEGQVELILFSESGSELSRLPVTFDAGWKVNLATDQLTAGDYQLRAVATHEGELFVSSMQKITLVEERVILCGAPEQVLLGNALSITGQVMTVSGTPEVGRTVALTIQPATAQSTAQYLPATTDSAGTFTALLQTTKTLAGEASITAQALGADLKGLSFTSAPVTSLVAGVELMIEPLDIKTGISVATNITITARALGADLELSSLELIPDAQHSAESNLVITLDEPFAAKTLTNGQSMALTATLHAKAQIEELPVCVEAGFTLNTLGTYTNQLELIFSAAAEKVVEITCTPVRIYFDGEREEIQEWGYDNYMLSVPGGRTLYFEVTITNLTGHTLHDLYFGDPGYPVKFDDDIIEFLDPWGSKTIPVEIQTFDPPGGKKRIPISIEIFGDEFGDEPGDSWPIDLDIDSEEPHDVELRCLLQDQYNTPLTAQSILLENDDERFYLRTDDQGVARQFLPEGSYSYTVDDSGRYPYSNCEGTIEVQEDAPLSGECSRTVTITVDPFGLSLQKTVSQTTNNLGEAEVSLVMDSDEKAPLQLSHPGHEYALMMDGVIPPAYTNLSVMFNGDAIDNQLTIMNNSDEMLTQLTMKVSGELAEYFTINGEQNLYYSLGSSFIPRGNIIIGWEFKTMELLLLREAKGEDILLDGSLEFSTAEGFKTTFHLRLRVGETFALHNGSEYAYVTYTDWAGRPLPVGMDTLPLWMGKPGASVEGTNEAGLMANISQEILATGESFRLENKISNQLPDQDLLIDFCGLKILDLNGEDVTDRFSVTPGPSLDGLSLAPKESLTARWDVTLADPTLGGASPNGLTYWAVFCGNTWYGSNLIPYEQKKRFTVTPAPQIQVSYSFTEMDARSGLIIARVTNSGFGPARNLTIEPASMSGMYVTSDPTRNIPVLAPGNTEELTWFVKFDHDIYSTEVLGKLKSLDPMMEGADGSWVKAPVTHEFRYEHTLEEVINQVDDLMNALENKTENECSELIYFYQEIESLLKLVYDVQHMESGLQRTSALVNQTFSAVNYYGKIRGMVGDVKNWSSTDMQTLSKHLYDKSVQTIITQLGTDNFFGEATSKSFLGILNKDLDLTGGNGVIDAMSAYNKEVLTSTEILMAFDDVFKFTNENYAKLYKFVQADYNNQATTATALTAEEIRSQLTYRSVDSRELMVNMSRFLADFNRFPNPGAEVEQLYNESNLQTVKGTDALLETTKALCVQLKLQLSILAQSKTSAIFPIDQLYNELRTMTATLATYDVSVYVKNPNYERKTVETPKLENADTTSEVYWYALGTTPDNWGSMTMQNAKFGSVKELIDPTYRHLQLLAENASYHNELVGKMSMAMTQKFFFDSMSGLTTFANPMMGAGWTAISAGAVEALNGLIDTYQLGLRIARDGEKIGLTLVFDDLIQFQLGHQKETGSVWTFMRDFGGHVDYLVANKPIDPELSVEVLSFEIHDAEVPAEGEMGLSTGVISLRNNGELDWRGNPVINIFADGLRVQQLELPTLLVKSGEEGIVPLVMPQVDAQIYSLFGYDYELSFTLWDDETLSSATCGPWITSSQAGTKERLGLLSSLGTQRLLEHSFVDDATVSQTYTATEDGALRFMMLHNAAATMDLYVYDESGNMAGFDYGLMDVVCEIPDAQFSGVDHRCQIVTIRNVEAGSEWTVDVEGIDVESQDKMVLTVTELPDAPAKFFTMNEENRTLLNGTNAVLTALLQEVGGTHSVTNLELATYTDPVDSNGVALATELLVFSFADNAEVLEAGGSVQLGVSVVLSENAADGLYTMSLDATGTDTITGEGVTNELYFAIELDRTAPDAPTFALNADTNYVGLMVASGMAEPESTVEIWSTNGQMVIEVGVDTNGLYQSAPFGLEYGDYELYAIAKDLVENESEPSDSISYSETRDWFAPETTLEKEGQKDEVGAYVPDVTVTLSATDNSGDAVETFVSLDEGETWQLYTAPLTFTEVGHYALKYYSEDAAGNRESKKYSAFWITEAKTVEAYAAWSEQIDDKLLRNGQISASGDGIANLLKYALGLDPNQFHTTSDLFTQQVDSDGRFSVIYQLAKTTLDVEVTAYWSPTLIDPNWQPVTALQKISETANYEKWKATLPAGDRGFVRLHVRSLGFEIWAEQAIEDPNLRGADDCPAADGVPNLLKYAMDIAPQTAVGITDLLALSHGEEGVTVVFHQKQSANDIALELLWSSSLNGKWKKVEELQYLDNDQDHLVWQATLPDTETAFIRLQASQ